MNAQDLYDRLLYNLPPRKPHYEAAALVLTHNKPRPHLVPNATAHSGERGTRADPIAMALSACDEVASVVIKSTDRVCLALLEMPEAPPYHVLRLKRASTR